jgi:hypothetical protein
MKKLLLSTFITSLTFTSMFAQVNFNSYKTQQAQTYLKITCDTKKFGGLDCAAGADVGQSSTGILPPQKLYLHSGLCTSTLENCFNAITVLNSAVWEHVVGNWQGGLCPDDGVGLMQHEGNGIWTKEMIIEQYFSNPALVFIGATSSGPSTLMPSSATPFTLGYVFRNEACLKGADMDLTNPNSTSCNDYFITNLNTSSPNFVNPIDFDTTYVPGSTLYSLGINDPTIKYYNHVFPNPISEYTKIHFFTTSQQDHLSMKIYDAKGTLVKTLHDGKLNAGDQYFAWNRTNLNSDRVEAGMYYLVITGKNSVITDKLIVIE